MSNKNSTGGGLTKLEADRRKEPQNLILLKNIRHPKVR